MSKLNGKTTFAKSGDPLSKNETARRSQLQLEKPYVYEKILNYEENFPNNGLGRKYFLFSFTRPVCATTS